MKVKTLLPLVTIATASTVVTPIAISCGNGYNTFKIPSLEELKDYKFVEQKKGKMKDNTQVATKTYFEDVKVNNKIFVDDYIKCLYYFDNAEADIKSNEWLAIHDVKPDEGRVSTWGKWEGTGTDSKGQKYDMWLIQEIKNVKWEVRYVLQNESFTSHWVVTPAFKTVEELKNDPDWSYSYQTRYYNPATDRYDSEDISISSKSDDKSLERAAEVLQHYSEDMKSWYLGQVTLDI